MKYKKSLEQWQKNAIFLAIYDVLAVSLSYGITLWLRFDMQVSTIPKMYTEAWASFAPIYALFCLIVFWFLRLYRSLWEFASYFELSRIAISSVITDRKSVV